MAPTFFSSPFLLHHLSLYCCGTFILISNYGPQVCGPVWVPLDDNTGDICAGHNVAARGPALPVVAASGKPIMAFNWDFNCVRWSKSIEYKARRYLSACARPLCKYTRCPSPSPLPLLGLASGFYCRSQSRSTRVESRMCHAMHGICILKAYRRQFSPSSSIRAQIRCRLCRHKDALGVRRSVQKLPAKLLRFHTIHICPLVMSGVGGWTDVNRQPFAHYGCLSMISFGQRLSWTIAWWRMIMWEAAISLQEAAVCARRSAAGRAFRNLGLQWRRTWSYLNPCTP